MAAMQRMCQQRKQQQQQQQQQPVRTTKGTPFLGRSVLGSTFFMAVVFVVSRTVPTALGFSSRAPQLCPRCAATALHATAGARYPPMSRDEVQAALDAVPVFAVTEPNQEGLVLLKEKGNPRDIAYFFFSPQAANTVFSPLRKKENESSGAGEWSVSAYPLGLVWFELINEPEEGVEYRLLPEPEDLIGAQNLLQQQQKQSNKVDPRLKDLFQSPFNEVPVFVDQLLRVTSQEGDDQRERVPLYLGLRDLMDAVNQATKATSGEYQAAITGVNLRDLIDEMMSETGNDYRRAIFVPPSAKPEAGEPEGKEAAPPAAASSSSPESGMDDDLDDFQKIVEGGRPSFKATNDGPINTPTASDDLWA